MNKKEVACPQCGETLRWETRGAREVGWCVCNPQGPVVNRPVSNRPVVNRLTQKPRIQEPRVAVAETGRKLKPKSKQTKFQQEANE